MPPDSRPALRAADFGTRFSAFVIDTALLFALQWIVFMAVSRQLQAVGMTSTGPCGPDSSALCQSPSSLLWAVLLMFLMASTVGYYAYFDGVLGATPGKRWMDLRVVDSTGDAPIGLGAGAVRAVVRQAFWLSLFFILAPSPLSLDLPAALFLLVPVVALAPLVWAAFDPTGMGLHDRAATTMVVPATEAARGDGPDPGDATVSNPDASTTPATSGTPATSSTPAASTTPATSSPSSEESP